MSTDRKAEVAIVGAGILGLAHAYFAARRGKSVVVFERTPRAQGASVRNFGMIWPIGQRAGAVHQIATRSRQIWNEILDAAGLPYRPTGSLHVVYHPDEADVAREFVERAPGLGYTCTWLSPAEVLKKSNSINPKGLLGAIWSPTELTVDPRQILAKLPQFLAEKFGVQFRFGAAVRSIQLPRIEAGPEIWRAERAIVCSGDDFETLYPELFAGSAIDRCKLQMMRTAPQRPGWELGPALAAGLTLRFYPAFEICTATLPIYKERVARELADYDRFAIHTLVSQTADGALTLGDSHEYGLAVDIFNKTEIDELVTRNVREFLVAPDLSIAQRWYGVYAKHPDKSWLALDAAPGVRIVTAVGGSGMTLSFGLAEQMIREMDISRDGYIMMQSYSGPVKAVILDWAGTTVDHGSLAPVRVLQEVFAGRGVPISEEEARRDMGVLKIDHIRKILLSPNVSARWRDATMHDPTEADVESLFANFVPLQLECLVKYSTVIDGVAETVARIRKRGIKIGSTTGYTHAMLEKILRPAAEQGYRPDCAITPDDVGAGRPHPWMIFANAIRLQVEPLEAVVKIGDTPVDIEEGLHAGVWTIGVARTGNMIGLSAEDFAVLAPAERAGRLEKARARLAAAGAHEVIDAVADCERALDAIESRIRSGKRP